MGIAGLRRGRQPGRRHARDLRHRDRARRARQARASSMRSAWSATRASRRRSCVPRSLRCCPRGPRPSRRPPVADEASQILQEGLGFFRTALLVFAAVALFVGSFIIFNTFSIIVAQRTRELALLRALGASRRQVVVSVVVEAFVVGLVASVVGILAGIGIAIGLQGAARRLQHRPAEHRDPAPATHDHRLARAGRGRDRGRLGPARPQGGLGGADPGAARGRRRAASAGSRRAPTRDRRGRDCPGGRHPRLWAVRRRDRTAHPWSAWAPRSRSSASRCSPRWSPGRSPVLWAARSSGCRSRRVSGVRTRCEARDGPPRRRPPS